MSMIVAGYYGTAFLLHADCDPVGGLPFPEDYYYFNFTVEILKNKSLNWEAELTFCKNNSPTSDPEPYRMPDWGRLEVLSIPNLTIDWPSSDGYAYAGSNIKINGTANGTKLNIDTVWINDSRFTLTNDPSGNLFGNYEFQNESFVPDGRHAIKVYVNNTEGGMNYSVRWFNVDNTIPEINITEPSSDGLIISAPIKIRGFVNGTGSNISSIAINDSHFIISTSPIGSGSGWYEFNNNSFLPDGPVNIEINVTDQAGFSSTLSTWFIVDNNYPIITILKPNFNGTIQVGKKYEIIGFVNGTGSSISSVYVNDGRFVLSTNPIGNNWGRFSFFNNSYLPDGLITLTISANNSASLTSNVTISFEVLQNSNDTAQNIYSDRENIMYGTDSFGNITVELHVFVSSDTNLTMTTYNQNPTGFVLRNFIRFFSFILGNQTALINATIKLFYNEDELGKASELDLRVYYSNNSKWIKLNSTVNATGNYLEVFTTSLSYYAIAPKVEQKIPILFLPQEETNTLLLIALLFCLIAGILFSILVISSRSKSKTAKKEDGKFKKSTIS